MNGEAGQDGRRARRKQDGRSRMHGTEIRAQSGGSFGEKKVVRCSRDEDCPLRNRLRVECDNTTGTTGITQPNVVGSGRTTHEVEENGTVVSRDEVERSLDRLGRGNAFVGSGAKSIQVVVRVAMKCT